MNIQPQECIKESSIPYLNFMEMCPGTGSNVGITGSSPGPSPGPHHGQASLELGLVIDVIVVGFHTLYLFLYLKIKRTVDSKERNDCYSGQNEIQHLLQHQPLKKLEKHPWRLNPTIANPPFQLTGV
jgi:hypothetical protein